MKKIVACCCLFAGLAGATFLDSSASAQSKKEAAGSVKIMLNKAGKYYYVVRNADEKYVASSNPVSYATEKEAMAAIEELKKIIDTVKPVVDKTPPKEDGKGKGKKVS